MIAVDRLKQIADQINEVERVEKSLGQVRAELQRQVHALVAEQLDEEQRKELWELVTRVKRKE